MLNENTFSEIIPILREYYLPQKLENLNLEPDVISILLNNQINNCFTLLYTDLDILYKLFENENLSFYKAIEDIFILYNKNLKQK